MLRHFTQNHKSQPHSGARGSPKSVEHILWGPWKCVNSMWPTSLWSVDNIQQCGCLPAVQIQLWTIKSRYLQKAEHRHACTKTHTHAHTEYLLKTEALVMRTKHLTLQVDQHGPVWTQPGTAHWQVVPRQTLWFGGRRMWRDQMSRVWDWVIYKETETVCSPQFPSRSSLNNADLKHNFKRKRHWRKLQTIIYTV